MNTGDKVTFDVTGRLNGDQVSIGCQTVSLADVLANRAPGGSLSVEGTTVRARVTGTSTGDRSVEFIGGRRFSMANVREYASNLIVESVTPPPPPFGVADLVPGMVLVDENDNHQYYVVLNARPRPLTERRGGYPIAKFGDSMISWDYLDYWTEKGARLAPHVSFQVVERFGSTPTAPDPATLAWQDGDRVVFHNNRGEPRVRRGGVWRTERTGYPSGFSDADYDGGIARGQVAVLRKGGVNF